MAQQYDVSLKLLFRKSTGLVARALFGGRIREWVNVELPRVQNPRVDLLARMADGSLRHVEVESRCQADMARRQAEYYLGLHRRFDEHVEQVVLYVGEAPMRVRTQFKTVAMRFEFRLLDIRDFPAAHPPLDETYRRKLVQVFPFGLIYRVDGLKITIVAVMHLTRRPGYWRKRLATIGQ